MSDNNLIFPLLIAKFIFRNKNNVFSLSSAQLGYNKEVKEVDLSVALGHKVQPWCSSNHT